MHTDKSKISVVLSVYNEAENLPRTLKSLDWADEIILVDNNSTDDTVKIASQFTRKIYSKVNNPMLNVNKNFGFSKATGDWILSLDGDEEIPQLLAHQIQDAVHGISDLSGYWIPRKNIIFGKWIAHGLWWPDEQLRLFRTGKGRFPCRHIHEKLTVEGKTGTLTEPYFHYNYSSVSQYLKKLGTIYTDSDVTALRAANYKPVWTDAIRFPLSDFIKIYFAQRGYLDGLHGLVLALLQAFYSFITYIKLWEAEGFPSRDISLSQIDNELIRSKKEVGYWIYTTKIEQTHNLLKIYWLRVLRRIFV